MTTYYKATRPDGRDFHSGTVDYAAALESGSTIKHKRPKLKDVNAAHYLSLSVEPGDCTGMSWPCRLFEVEPVSDVWTPHKDDLPNKRAVTALKVVRELPPETVFGKQAAEVLAIVARFDTLTTDEKSALRRAVDSTPGFWTAWDAVADLGGLAGRVGLAAARRALSDQLRGWVVGSAACGAALAVLLRDQKALARKDYATLTAPWRAVIGSAHPKDRLKVGK